MKKAGLLISRRYPIIGDGEGEEEDKVKVMKDDKGREYYQLGERRLFTQEHMDHEIGLARKKATENNKTLITQLEEMQQRATTSEAMKAELQEQIENLKAQSLSKEEQMAQRMKTLETDLAKTQKTLAEERDSFKNLWQEERIANALNAASVEHNAFSTEQIYGLLRHKSELKPVLNDEGKVTGNYEVIVLLDTKDGVKQLAPAAALKTMREEMKEKYGNLFKSQEAAGIGGGTINGSGVISDTPPPEALKSQDAYDSWKAARLQNKKGK